MNRHRIKLLITLVLFTVALAAVWTSSQAGARGLSGPGASSVLSANSPGATPAAGDPDIGQGIAPPPPTMKHMRRHPGSGTAKGQTLSEWVRWTGRIWVTLYLRAAR
jgi:hypothetical protein